MDKHSYPLKMWDEITYPFSNFNGVTIEVWEQVSNFIPCDYLKSIHVSKRGPWYSVWFKVHHSLVLSHRSHLQYSIDLNWCVSVISLTNQSVRLRRRHSRMFLWILEAPAGYWAPYEPAGLVWARWSCGDGLPELPCSWHPVPCRQNHRTNCSPASTTVHHGALGLEL